MSEQHMQFVFGLDKVYLKDASLEVPNSPAIFLNQDRPNVDLNLSFDTIKIDEGIYETVIHAVVDGKIGAQQMFLIEIDQAGVFQMRNIPQEQMELLHNIECPNAIFPYLRETVSDLTTRAGFLPVVLAPVNFAYLYQQKIQAQTQGTNETIN